MWGRPPDSERRRAGNSHGVELLLPADEGILLIHQLKPLVHQLGLVIRTCSGQLQACLSLYCLDANTSRAGYFHQLMSPLPYFDGPLPPALCNNLHTKPTQKHIINTNKQTKNNNKRTNRIDGVTRYLAKI